MNVGSTGDSEPGRDQEGQLSLDGVSVGEASDPPSGLAAATGSIAGQSGDRVVRVLPDVAAVSRAFDYLVPDAWSDDGRAERLGIGSRVRIVLHGRRVAGWVVADWVDPPLGVTLRPLARLSGLGPDPSVIDLARWAARRWVGPVSSFLSTASSPSMVEALPSAPAGWCRPREAVGTTSRGALISAPMGRTGGRG